MPNITLPTDDDMRSITSATLAQIFMLPYLYIAADEPGVMKSWGVALLPKVVETERLYPGALVAPKFAGQRVERGELIYNGAELAADFAA